VDMDETLCDYSGAVAAAMAGLRSPNEDPAEEASPNPPAHIAARQNADHVRTGF
jgi:hypothetical protein